jgi:hypothetical protein
MEYSMTRLIQDLGCLIAEELLGRVIPKADLSFKRYDKCCIRGSLKQPVHIAGKHMRFSLRRLFELTPISHGSIISSEVVATGSTQPIRNPILSA